MKIVDDERESIADGMAARIANLKAEAEKVERDARTLQRTSRDEAHRDQARGMLIFAEQLACQARALEQFEPLVRNGRDIFGNMRPGYMPMRIGFSIPEEPWDNAARALATCIRSDLEADAEAVDEDALSEACLDALYELVADAAYHALEWAGYEENICDRHPSVKNFDELWRGCKSTAWREYQRRVRDAKKKAASMGSGQMTKNTVTVSIPRPAGGGQGGIV